MVYEQEEGSLPPDNHNQQKSPPILESGPKPKESVDGASLLGYNLCFGKANSFNGLTQG